MFVLFPAICLFLSSCLVPKILLHVVYRVIPMVERTMLDTQGEIYVWMHVLHISLCIVLLFPVDVHLHFLGSFACLMLVESPSGSGLEIDGLPCIDR